MKIDEMLKEHHPICCLDKIFRHMILFKPASITYFKGFHQFSCKIQVLLHGNLPHLKQVAVSAKNLCNAVLFKGRHAVFYGLIPKNFHC